MTTTLPAAITNATEAAQYLTDLYNNGECYHPDDDAHQIAWQSAEPTPAEADQLNKLMADIFGLAGNEDLKVFDPYGFFLQLDGHTID